MEKSATLKRLVLLIAVFLNSLTLLAQPAYYNGNSGTGNAIPFNFGTAYNYFQSNFGPGIFNSAGSTGTPAWPGDITTVYIYIPSAGSPTTTYNDLTIKMGQMNGTNAGFPNTTFFTSGFTQVFYSSAFQFTGVASNTWFPITLQTPFTYDPTLALVVEITYTNNVSSGGHSVANITTTGFNTRLYGPLSSTTGSSSASQMCFGIDLVPSGPCTTPPTPGIVTTSNANPCFGQSVSLNLSGNSYGTGQSYQWESTTNLSGTWTLEGSANVTAGITVTPGTSGITYYRCGVTCSGSSTEYSDTMAITVPTPFPGGTYTIDAGAPASGTNFQSFGAAAAAINCGISGPIVFNVASNSGPYNEQIDLPATIGSDATNTVTFNGNGNTLTMSTPTSSYATVNINGADYITFNDLTIEALGSNGFGVHLMNGANNNSFHRCTINANPTATGTTSGCVSMSGSTTSYSTGGTNGSNNLFDSCSLSGGYFGFAFYSVSGAAGDSMNNITNCTIRDYYVYGSYNYYQGSATISNNIFDRATRTTVSTAYGVMLSTGCVNMLVEKNTVRNMFPGSNSGTGYLFYCSSDGTAGRENKFINNLVYNIGGNGTLGGLYLTGADYVQVYNNTIVLDNQAATGGDTYGIYNTGTVGGIDIKNNNIYIARGGNGTKYCLYYTGAGAKSSDYNNLYISSFIGSNNIGYSGSAQSSFASWQTATGAGSPYDANSQNEDPLFSNASGGNLTPNNSLMDDKGISISNVIDDIYGTIRNASNPDIGAIEFTVPPCSGAPSHSTIAGPTLVCPNEPLLISVSGNQTGAGIIYDWQYDDGAGWQSTGYTSASLIIPMGITQATDYRLITFCNNSSMYDTSNILSVAVNPNFMSCYCVPTGGNIYTYGINSFSTTGGWVDINNLNTGASVGGYVDYSATNTLVTSIGSTITVNASGAGTTTYGWAIWVDWNKNGRFDDPGEKVYNSTSYINAIPANTTFTIPALDGNNNPVDTGYRKMRVAADPNNSNPSGNICYPSTAGYMEWEDYMVNITDPPSCLPPSAPTASNVLVNSADLSWIENNSATTWVIEYGPAPLIPGTGTVVTATSNPYSITSGLTAITNYQFYVKSVCAPGVDTSLAAMGSFTTPCATFTAPFTESFNGSTTPNCWTVTNASAGGTWLYGTSLNNSYGITSAADHTGNGGRFAWVDGSSPIVTGQITMLTSPIIDIAALTAPQLRYYIISYINPTYLPNLNKLAVDAYDFLISDWVPVDSVEQNFSSEAWQERIVPLTGVTSTLTQLRFRFEGMAATTFYNDILIDDITVETMPTCPAPNTLAAANPTTSSLDVSWNSVSSATQYQIEYAQSTGFTPGTGAGILAGPAGITNPYTVTGLTSGLPYTFYVRDICGANDTSAWAGPVTAFTAFPALPPNDDCGTAVDISDKQWHYGSTSGATQSLAACDATTTSTTDVWYSFTTTAAGTVTDSINTIISGMDAVVQLFSGSCTGTLTPVTPTASIGTHPDATCIDGPLAAEIEWASYSVTANTTYYIRVYTFGTLTPGAFSIKVTGAPLAIKLDKLSAVNAGSSNKIEWNTLSEERGDKFELEHSADGKNFTAIYKKAANGEASRYTYMDNNPVKGMNHYRLRMIEANGNATYSEVVKAFVKSTGFEVEAYPNPVSHDLTVQVSGVQGTDAAIQVTDVTGKLIKNIKMTTSVEIINMSGLANGIYLIKYSDANHTQTIRVNKQ